MEGSKCGSPPSWFERDQFRTLIVQSNPSAEIWMIAGSHAAPYHFGLEVRPLVVQSNHGLEIGSYAPANPPPSKYIFQSLKAGSSRKMALSCANSLANLCSFVYLLPPDSSLSASRIYLLIANSFIWRSNCFFLSPLPNDRSL
jgi:hypothetical protein